MIKINLGDLNRLARIIKRSEYGDFAEEQTDTQIGNAWCDLKPVGSQIRYGSVQVGEPITHRATMRYREDLTPDHFLHISGREYRVRGWQPVAGKRAYILVDLEDIKANEQT